MTNQGREWTTKPYVRAYCDTCGWTCDAKNAHGLGAQHARRHKHYVSVVIERTSVYDHQTTKEK